MAPWHLRPGQPDLERVQPSDHRDHRERLRLPRWAVRQRERPHTDVRRIQWYRDVLAELARAIADGARVRAYHAWTLVDNFQWAEGYTERYGLIYTDFRSQKRTVKDSGFWYSRVAASNRLDA